MGKTKPGIVLGTMEVQMLAPNKWCYECKRGVLVAHLVLLIKESPPSLVGAPASTRCQKRWSSLASPPPLPPPPMVASSSTGWTLLTCTQEGRCEEKLPFGLSEITLWPKYDLDEAWFEHCWNIIRYSPVDWSLVSRSKSSETLMLGRGRHQWPPR